MWVNLAAQLRFVWSEKHVYLPDCWKIRIFPLTNLHVMDSPSVSPSPPRPEKLVWHGSSTVGIRLTTNYCEAWRTADMAVTGQAALLQTGRLLGQHTRSCSNHYIVLCIENTYVGNTHQRRTWRDTGNTHTNVNTRAGKLEEQSREYDTVHIHINLNGRHMQAHTVWWHVTA